MSKIVRVLFGVFYFNREGKMNKIELPLEEVKLLLANGKAGLDALLIYVFCWYICEHEKSPGFSITESEIMGKLQLSKKRYSEAKKILISNKILPILTDFY